MKIYSPSSMEVIF